MLHVQYILSLLQTCGLKQASGCQALGSHCLHIPTASSEASLVTAIRALGKGCASKAVLASAFLVAWKALFLSVDQIHILPGPFSAQGLVQVTYGMGSMGKKLVGKVHHAEKTAKIPLWCGDGEPYDHASGSNRNCSPVAGCQGLLGLLCKPKHMHKRLFFFFCKNTN